LLGGRGEELAVFVRDLSVRYSLPLIMSHSRFHPKV
jgi:hypothetical protein